MNPLPPAPPKKKKRVWLGKTPMPPGPLAQGAIVYDAEGHPITRPGSELLAQRYAETHQPRKRTGNAAVYDIPTIVERYISLVGKVIHDMDKRADKEPLKAHEVNSVASIGRAVAMLQAVENSSLTRPGGKPVKEHTSEQLRALLARSEAAELQLSAADSAEGAGSPPLSDFSEDLPE